MLLQKLVKVVLYIFIFFPNFFISLALNLKSTHPVQLVVIIFQFSVPFFNNQFSSKNTSSYIIRYQCFICSTPLLFSLNIDMAAATPGDFWNVILLKSTPGKSKNSRKILGIHLIDQLPNALQHNFCAILHRGVLRHFR